MCVERARQPAPRARQPQCWMPDAGRGAGCWTLLLGGGGAAAAATTGTATTGAAAGAAAAAGCWCSFLSLRWSWLVLALGLPASLPACLPVCLPVCERGIAPLYLALVSTQLTARSLFHRLRTPRGAKKGPSARSSRVPGPCPSPSHEPPALVTRPHPCVQRQSGATGALCLVLCAMACLNACLPRRVRGTAQSFRWLPGRARTHALSLARPPVDCASIGARPSARCRTTPKMPVGLSFATFTHTMIPTRPSTRSPRGHRPPIPYELRGKGSAKTASTPA